MRNGEKGTVGRALVKHHNQMVHESQERGHLYRAQQRNVLESITEVNDIDAVIEHAHEAYRLFTAHNPDLSINLDSASSSSEMTPEERREQREKEEALHASSLRIPRRPPWNARMSAEELDSNEKEALLEWRHSLARLEANKSLLLTPYEKNLDIWRQLWRVLERSDMIVMVVDARDPLFYRCPDLEAYAREIDPHKRTMLLVNKADLLPYFVRRKWAEYFHEHGIPYIFWSAKAATATLEGKKLNLSWGMKGGQQESADSDTKVYGRDELLSRLQSEAEEIVSGRSSTRGVMVGFVGYPNVGKSSTINALVGEKKTGVTSTSGKTKHFQTLIISEKLTLCDCPGLVFPSFTSSTYDMIASGVLSSKCMTQKENQEAVQVVANRVPRSAIESVYGISLPKPKPYEPQSRPPLALEFLETYSASRGYIASDETKVGCQIVKDYINGKLPHFEMPPGASLDKKDGEEEVRQYSSSNRAAELKLSDDKGDEAAPSVTEKDIAPRLEHMLSDLNSFDLANGLASTNKAVKARASAAASYKQHKKPQRKKDRTWRALNHDGNGMPIVRAFQRPVNTGQSEA